MNNIPRHVAIIMDGNGRWANKRALPRFAGHRQGIENIKEIIKAAKDLGIEVLTLFAFSTENWSRPKDEVDMLMNSLNDFLNKHTDKLNADNICFRVSGRDYPVPKKLLDNLKRVQNLTKENTGIILNLAFNYGSRQEIVDIIKKMSQDVKNDKLDIEDINEDKVSGYLYTSGLPDVDFLIRTSGEMRISNFLLWQISYAELYFTDIFWPDFSKEEFKKALIEYAKRQRRFGNVG